MGNQGGNAGNQGRNAWNQVGNLGNQGGNVGNQGGNAGNQGGDVGNAGNQYKGNIKLMKCHQSNELDSSHQTKKQKDVISDRPHVLISFIHLVDRTIKRVTIVRQLPIKAR